MSRSQEPKPEATRQTTLIFLSLQTPTLPLIWPNTQTLLSIQSSRARPIPVTNHLSCHNPITLPLWPPPLPFPRFLDLIFLRITLYHYSHLGSALPPAHWLPIPSRASLLILPPSIITPNRLEYPWWLRWTRRHGINHAKNVLVSPSTPAISIYFYLLINLFVYISPFLSLHLQ